jgi:methionyl-tRNA formyltransferase
MDRIILLCSGNLGLIAAKLVYARGQLCFVFTDKDSAAIITYCTERKIPFYAGNPRKESAKEVIQALHCDVLLSVNYLFIVGKDLLSVADKFAINFHGSLLPKYRGRTPHVWAIINGEKESGVTAHLMTDAVDNGGIVKQVRVPIEDDDTGYTVLQKFNALYPELIEETLNDIAQGTLTASVQNHNKATYFGKRTPDDGEINWDWHKERIRNWVRAQAAPYPGAFSFYEGEKVIIHELQFSDWGFCYTDVNGLILQTEPRLIVKTPNGAVVLKTIETPAPIQFEKGKRLCSISQLVEEKLA